MRSACPSTTVAAPIEVVWDLLTTPAGYGAWVNARVTRVSPPGPACAGQEVTLRRLARGGRWMMRLTIECVDADARTVALRAALPLGVRLQERISCIAVAGGTRIQFG